jgi:diguanylate cyclase (GGDEF)-like protein
MTGLIVVLVLGAGMLLQHQVSVRAQEGAVETARLVTALVVQRNVPAADFAKSRLTPAQVQGMDADIAELLRQRRLVGLEIWRLDGHLLYADANHPAAETTMPAHELNRARQDQPWINSSAGDANGRSQTLEVFLPFDTDADAGVDAIVEVLIPEHVIADQIGQSTRELYAVVALLLVALVGVLLVLRRRLMAREYDALHDPLTGLPNRAALRRETDRAIDSARAAPGRHAALLVLDLDGFKAINDTLGHPAGDSLLRQVAESLRESVRPVDVVSRLGGDEFAILLTQLPSETQARVIALHLLARLRANSYQVDGVALSVDASIGVALLPNHGEDSDLLLQRADVAMYQAKRAHTDVAVYDEAKDTHDVSQLGLLAELRRAVELDELTLHYQPKVSLVTGNLEGVEALVRWEHPTRGLLPPGDFIPMAENTGLMQPLTEWVLRRAIGQAVQWRDAGLMIAVAVNLSPLSLLDQDLPRLVLRLLADASLPAHLLELEITETAIMTDPARATQVLTHLQAMGVRVAIDDFGVGYTSLAYLKTLPVATLKIDRCFIAEILHSDKDQAIVESVIGLGHKLGLTVLAEGIESEVVRERLISLNCDEGQGYHIGRPMTPEQLDNWIIDHLRVATAAAHDGI